MYAVFIGIPCKRTCNNEKCSASESVTSYEANRKLILYLRTQNDLALAAASFLVLTLPSLDLDFFQFLLDVNILSETSSLALTVSMLDLDLPIICNVGGRAPIICIHVV